MTVVIDSTMLTCLVSGDGRVGIVSRQLNRWFRDEVTVHAPALISFEIADFLSNLVAAERLSIAQVSRVWSDLAGMSIEYHLLKNVSRVVEIAAELGHSDGFNAAYLALGEELGAPLWTLNRRLHRRASKSGFRVIQPSPP